MKKILYLSGSILAISVLIIAGVIFSLTSNVFGDSTQSTDEIRNVTEDIRLLNLINGLELDEEQMEFIMEKAKEAEQLKADFLSEVNGGNSDIAAVMQPLYKLKTQLMNDQNVPDDLKGQVHKANNWIKETKLAYDDSISGLAEEIEGILEPHQLYCLETYVPCLITPKAGAAGQVAGSEALVRHLTRIREIPDKIYNDREDQIVEQTFKRVKQHLPKGYVMDEQAEKDWIAAAYREVRNMSDEDFTFKKVELAEKQKSRYELPKPEIDICVKIERFLLNPAIISLLESKLDTATF